MGREGEKRAKGFVQIFKGKSVPAEKPPDDEIKISYKPEKDKQNHTKIINDGTSELRFTIVYYDYDEKGLMQKGWYTIDPNSEEELLFDVYYIYAYETDLYGEYVRLTDKHHFSIPEDNFEGSAEKCKSSEGYGFKQCFSGNDIPSRKPPSDMIKVSYKPEKEKQNHTKIFNDGDSEIRFAIVYYDYDAAELMAKGWYNMDPNSEEELPYDVYYLYAYETDLYGEYIRLTGKDNFNIPEDDFEGSAEKGKSGEGYGFEQWFSGKDVPARKPPSDMIKVSYKPEKEKQNLTKIVNDGDSEIRFAVVYYDYDVAELMAKGWYNVDPNSEEELPYDVYYIYAYETDLYEDYLRLTGENHFNIPDEDFEDSADPCESGEGFGFKQWFSGKNIPAADPPKDEITISYKPEKFVQNHTVLVNDGGGPLNTAVIYYDWVQMELNLKCWYQIQPHQKIEIPFDVFCIYAFEEDDDGEWHTVLGRNKYYFEVSEEEFEGSAKITDKNGFNARGFEMISKDASELIKAAQISKMLPDADKLFAKISKPIDDLPADIIVIENKTDLEKARLKGTKELAKAAKYDAKREKGNNHTRIDNAGGGELKYVIVHYNENEKKLYQKGWFTLPPHYSEDIPYDVYYIYAEHSEPSGGFFRLTDKKDNFFKIPSGNFDEPAVSCAKGESRLGRGFKKIFKGDRIPAPKPPKDNIKAKYKTKEEQVIADAIFAAKMELMSKVIGVAIDSLTAADRKMHEIQVKALEKQKEEADKRAIQYEEQQRKEREKWKQEQARKRQEEERIRKDAEKKRQEQLAAKEQARKDAEAEEAATGAWIDFAGDKVYFYLCKVDFIHEGEGDMKFEVAAIDDFVEKEIDRKQDSGVDTEDCEDEWIEVVFNEKSHKKGLILIVYNQTRGGWNWAAAEYDFGYMAGLLQTGGGVSEGVSWAHVTLMIDDGQRVSKKGSELGFKLPWGEETAIVMLRTTTKYTNVVSYKFDWEE